MRTLEPRFSRKQKILLALAILTVIAAFLLVTWLVKGKYEERVYGCQQHISPIASSIF